MSDPHPTPDPDAQRTRRVRDVPNGRPLFEQARPDRQVVIEDDLAARLHGVLARAKAAHVCAMEITAADLVHAALSRMVEETLTPDEK